MLGEYAFALSNEYYGFRATARDPQAPVEITYFKDYNQTNFVFYVVRKGDRHPATLNSVASAANPLAAGVTKHNPIRTRLTMIVPKITLPVRHNFQTGRSTLSFSLGNLRHP